MLLQIEIQYIILNIKFKYIVILQYIVILHNFSMNKFD